ncbi:acetyltransferase, GNAT family [Synechococcus sp. PCC 7335]|uniref:GNAT family N-acetyltransferase n=1 Tax=Synechococcus sp. (strain ATCC 29403 / PCC 7335) TaxID=91464 RepID=UPI00017EB4D3|nr:GNAT family N-acetyltransferase [Synechococcus sp. PCC 7335]EDX86900.1 acetyltransferase, GNAT family [Synechococcus sp. PCC 7335]
MVKIYELETDRLRLRQWTQADKLPFARLNGDERVMEFFPHPLSRLESDALAEKIMSAFGQRGWGWWAVEVTGAHDFIGFVGLNIPSADLPFQPCVEVGWRLDYPYWGYGYASEAAKAALGFGFDTLALEKIVSFTAVVNKRSEAVMRKLGMHRAPETFMHPNVPKDHALREHCLYELKRTDWESHTMNTKK